MHQRFCFRVSSLYLCLCLFVLSGCGTPKVAEPPAPPARKAIIVPGPAPVVPAQPLPRTSVAVSEANQRHALIAIARKQVGVKEHPLGSNRGPEVDAYNRSAATDMGAPWCAAVKVWCHTEIGLPCRGNAYSPSWFVKAWVTLTPQPGDYALVYFPKMGRFAHTIVVIESAKYSGSRCVEVVTLEGNTNAQGSREGDQFARRNRRFDSVTCLRFQPAVSAAAL